MRFLRTPETCVYYVIMPFGCARSGAHSVRLRCSHITRACTARTGNKTLFHERRINLHARERCYVQNVMRAARAHVYVYHEGVCSAHA